MAASKLDVSKLTQQDILRMSVEELKSVWSVFETEFPIRMPKPELQATLAEMLGIPFDVKVSSAETVTLKSLGETNIGKKPESQDILSRKVVSDFESFVAIENSPVHSVRSVKSDHSSNCGLNAEQEFELQKMRIGLQADNERRKFEAENEREIRLAELRERAESEREHRKYEVDNEIRLAELRAETERRKIEAELAARKYEVEMSK